METIKKKNILIFSNGSINFLNSGIVEKTKVQILELDYRNIYVKKKINQPTQFPNYKKYFLKSNNNKK
jgi:hypothetical protein